MLKRWREKDQTSYAHKRQKNIKRKNGEEKKKESYVVTQLKRLDYYHFFFEFFDLKRKRTDFSHAKKLAFFPLLFFYFRSSIQ